MFGQPIAVPSKIGMWLEMLRQAEPNTRRGELMVRNFRTPDIPPLIPGILVCRGLGTFRKIRAAFWNDTALFSISMVE